MKLSIKLTGIVLGIFSGCTAIGLSFAASEIFQAKPTAATNDTAEVLEIPASGSLASQGYKLFMNNCAHCHGTDARGDEGPDLHGVTKSDAKIASYIKNGIKGEMPKFGQKLSDADVKALIAFIRSLKE